MASKQGSNHGQPLNSSCLPVADSRSHLGVLGELEVAEPHISCTNIEVVQLYQQLKCLIYFQQGNMLSDALTTASAPLIASQQCPWGAKNRFAYREEGTIKLTAFVCGYQPSLRSKFVMVGPPNLGVMMHSECIDTDDALDSRLGTKSEEVESTYPSSKVLITYRRATLWYYSRVHESN